MTTKKLLAWTKEQSHVLILRMAAKRAGRDNAATSAAEKQTVKRCA